VLVGFVRRRCGKLTPSITRRSNAIRAAYGAGGRGSSPYGERTTRWISHVPATTRHRWPRPACANPAGMGSRRNTGCFRHPNPGKDSAFVAAAVRVS
jgi:hypothetical protein